MFALGRGHFLVSALHVELGTFSSLFPYPKPKANNITLTIPLAELSLCSNNQRYDQRETI